MPHHILSIVQTTAGNLGKPLAGAQYMTFTGWEDTTGTPNVTYYYTVRATNYTRGANSNQASATPKAEGPDKTAPITTLEPPAGTYNGPIYVTLTTNEPAKYGIRLDGRFPAPFIKTQFILIKDTFIKI